MALCADYAGKFAKLSQYFEDGVSKPFLDLYDPCEPVKSCNLT